MLGGADDSLFLNLVALADEELASALRLLVGDDQEYLPRITAPLFLREEGMQVVAAMPTFDGRGLVPPASPMAWGSMTLVEVSLGDSLRGGGEEEDEEHDSEAALEGAGETSPPRMADILRTLLDDDEADATQEEEGPLVIPRKGSRC